MKKSLKAALVMLFGLVLAVSVIAPTAKAEEAPTPQEGYTAWESDNSLPQTGTVGKFYLTKDVTLTGQHNLKAGSDVTIDLMGHNIIQATDGKRIFRLDNGASLTIEDSTATGSGASYKAGALIGSGNWQEQGQIVGIWNRGGEAGDGLGSHFTMKGGIMDGSANTNSAPKSSCWGGAITLGHPGAMIDIYGGQFRNFTWNYGAVIGGSSFDYINICGGEFCNNHAIFNSSWTDGKADVGGGVIAVNSSSGTSVVNISGGSFHDNESRTGGVLLVNQSGVTVNISAGAFYNNSAKKSNGGGGIGGVIRTVNRANAKPVIISGGYFHDNYSEGNGSVLWMDNPFYIYGGQFYNNHTDGTAAIYVNKGGATLADCTIINNTAKNADIPAAFYMNRDLPLAMSGVITISGNTCGSGADEAPYDMLFGSVANVTGLQPGTLIMYNTDGKKDGFTSNATEEMTNWFVPFKDGYKTAFNDGVMSRVAKDPAEVLYTFTAGAGSIFTLTTDQTLTFTCDAAAADLTAVKVDDNVIDEKFYTVEAGSTIVTLSSEYLNGQSKGRHTIALVYDTVETAPVAFYVNAFGADTGDMSNAALWLAVMAAAMLAAGAVFFTVKRRSFNH